MNCISKNKQVFQILSKMKPFLIQFLLPFVLLLAVSGCEIVFGHDPWESFSDEDKKKLFECKEVFDPVEFRMTILDITYEDYKGKNHPAWFIGKVFSHVQDDALDSAQKYQCRYFDFSEWPMIKIRADFELVRKFKIGNEMIKKKGTCEVILSDTDKNGLCVFTVLRAVQYREQR